MTAVFPSDQASVTQLISLWNSGDRTVESRLFQSLYRMMREKAGYAMRAQQNRNSLSPTVLVHEAYLSLMGTMSRKKFSIRDSSHFLKLASRVMRNLVVDHIRARQAQIRGGGMHSVPLEDALFVADQDPDLVLAVAAALDELAVESPDAAHLVDLRFFAGFSEAETAALRGVSPRTLRRQWKVARARLHEMLYGHRPAQS